MRLPIVFVLLLLGVSSVFARVDHLSVSQDNRKNIYLQTFGFDEGGKIKLTFSNFKLDPAPSGSLGQGDAAKLGVVLRGAINGNRVRFSQDACLAGDALPNGAKVLAPESGSYDDWKNYEISLKVKDPAAISLFFTNCLDAKVSFDVCFILYCCQ